ncbi:type I DNA topoisomerase [Patescibacteria group bacterium]|nr:type I DNA topoisomerase [Patescibacteria group bacterium]MBU1472573.1 type I DNA topoisomerase [Patescibacteria group bacterium]MBU2459824.1 type I DNA topoisomerase [Patescibacteria group bacterium]MBU2544114.1 type I DNA topoisomerase [Patescibacteria group bacterium]
MQLIIVESPTKARTLTRFLGKDYRVEASMGHIRDLPKAALGVDIDHDFAPSYVIPKVKQKRVTELKEMAKKAKSIILATDPDREGEAIAWHVSELLKCEGKRIVFHEITESAIKEALANPREIDMQLVDAQQARRVLDRLVGYKLSPLLWQKLSKRWLSAGRVQSVTVRLIVEREREIAKFQSQEYWTIEGYFLCKTTPDTGNQHIKHDQIISAQLVSKDGVKYEQTLSYDLFDGKYTTTSSAISNQQSAIDIIKDLRPPFTVSAVDKKEIRRYPAPPFTTSTLQQEAGRRFYFSAKKTMQLAQKLYEEGLITYHRTDSFNLAEKFLIEARNYIHKEFGKRYLSYKPRRFKTKSKVAQEAHEAIRPTDLTINPPAGGQQLTSNNTELNRDHIRLYELIWKRAVASQAAEAVFDSTTITITSSNEYQFAVQGSVIKFDGFLKITGRPVSPARFDARQAGGENGEVELPQVAVGETLTLASAVPSQHSTNPPPRYSEASLVKTLEERGIGRPSTYAPIISTIQDRQYVVRQEKRLVPTELGNAVTDFLVRYFPNILDFPFTAKMEDQLDAIAAGEAQWVPVIREFYGPFANMLESTYQEAEKVKIEETSLEEPCPTCGSLLVIRMGRYGKFIACSAFPKCTYKRQILEKIDKKCPRCNSDIVVKKTKRGKHFYGCSSWPKCDFAAWKKEDIK